MTLDFRIPMSIHFAEVNEIWITEDEDYPEHGKDCLPLAIYLPMEVSVDKAVEIIKQSMEEI